MRVTEIMSKGGNFMWEKVSKVSWCKVFIVRSSVSSKRLITRISTIVKYLSKRRRRTKVFFAGCKKPEIRKRETRKWRKKERKKENVRFTRKESNSKSIKPGIHIRTYFIRYHFHRVTLCFQIPHKISLYPVRLPSAFIIVFYYYRSVSLIPVLRVVKWFIFIGRVGRMSTANDGVFIYSRLLVFLLSLRGSSTRRTENKVASALGLPVPDIHTAFGGGLRVECKLHEGPRIQGRRYPYATLW